MVHRFAVIGAVLFFWGLSRGLAATSMTASTPVTIAGTSANSTPAIGTIQPTVTAEMGDRGGRFFGQIPDPAKTRHYYIAAEPELWNFAPEGMDPICDRILPPNVILNRVSWKIRYVQYADADFTARVLPEPRLGILGPVLRATKGEYIAVTFLNRGWLPLSMHPHGVKYDKDSEGSYYKPNPGLGSAVAPGAKFTYVWQVDAAAAPGPNEPSSKAWLYHSHVTGDEEANLGLIGLIVVTDPARARPDGTPNDVDREMAVLFKIFDESNSQGEAVEDPDDAPVRPSPPAGPVKRTWAEVQQIAEEAERHSINGLIFGNLGGLEMNQGERVRWYTVGLGSEKDFHVAHWHAMRMQSGQTTTDVVELLPGSMKVADMVADVPGAWLLHCHVAEHMTEGMFARFTVYPTEKPGAPSQPEARFFGMPQSLQTLKFKTVELTERPPGVAPASGLAREELFLDGEVTVPDPLPVARTQFQVELAGQHFDFKPDASGLSAGQDGLLLIKNISPYGNGNVRGGTLQFELTLKGAKLREALAMKNDSAGNGSQAGSGSARTTASHSASVHLQIGSARHTAIIAITDAPAH